MRPDLGHWERHKTSVLCIEEHSYRGNSHCLATKVIFPVTDMYDTIYIRVCKRD